MRLRRRLDDGKQPATVVWIGSGDHAYRSRRLSKAGLDAIQNQIVLLRRLDGYVVKDRHKFPESPSKVVLIEVLGIVESNALPLDGKPLSAPGDVRSVPLGRCEGDRVQGFLHIQQEGLVPVLGMFERQLEKPILDGVECDIRFLRRIQAHCRRLG